MPCATETIIWQSAMSSPYDERGCVSKAIDGISLGYAFNVQLVGVR